MECRAAVMQEEPVQSMFRNQMVRHQLPGQMISTTIGATIKLYYTILYYTILYCTILYYTILYYTILHNSIFNYTILYYIILCYINMSHDYDRLTQTCSPSTAYVLPRSLLYRLCGGTASPVPPHCHIHLPTLPKSFPLP